MPEHHEIHRLRRALARMTIEATDAREAHDREIAAVAAGDMAQQIHASVEGRVARAPVFTEIDVTWPYPFLNDVAATDTSMENPSFASGVELRSESPVFIDAQVRSWTRDDSSFITGARVRVTAWAPNAAKMTRYNAVIHMVFLGYAAPTDDNDDDEVT